MLRGISIDKTMIPLISLTKKLLNADVNERERPAVAASHRNVHAPLSGR